MDTLATYGKRVSTFIEVIRHDSLKHVHDEFFAINRKARISRFTRYTECLIAVAHPLMQIVKSN